MEYFNVEQNKATLQQKTLELQDITYSKSSHVELTFKSYTNKWFSDRKLEKPYTQKIHKWGHTDDTIFDDLSSHINISEEQKEKIADLLNLFYYFIICYSKTCFKKNAVWNSKYKYNYHHKTNKLYLVGNTFDYNTANSLHSHEKLLEIQKQLHYYRKQYPEDKLSRERFWTQNKISEIIDIIEKSLGQMVNFIAVPLKLISPDINEKLNKYKYLEEKPKRKPSEFINYDLLKKILGNDLNSYDLSSSSL